MMTALPRASVAAFLVLALGMGLLGTVPAAAQDATFTISPTTTPERGETITLDGTASSGQEYEWRVDGQTVRSGTVGDGGLRFDRSFSSSGTKDITLELRTPNECGGFTCDPLFLTDVQTKTITVNDAPRISSVGAQSTNEDTDLTLSVTIRDSETATSNLSLRGTSSNPGLVPAPNISTSTSASGGSVTIAPAPDANGTADITLTVTDGDGKTDRTTFPLTVAPVDDPVQATNTSLTTAEDQSATKDLSGSISDVEDSNSELTLSVVNGPSNGSVSVSGLAVTYTPAPNFNGSDDVTYEVEDTGGNTAVATLDVTVQPRNDAPTASDAALTTDEDRAATVGLSSQVGDVETADEDLTLSVVSGPSNGTATVSGLQVTYEPDPNVNGSDRFTYEVTDAGGKTARATVDVTINAVNDAPTASDATLTTDEDQPATIDLSGRVGDVETPDEDLTLLVVSGPSRGTASVSGLEVTYAPNADVNGSDAFTYRVEDPGGKAALATVDVTINAVDDAPTAAAASATTKEDTPVSIDLSGQVGDPDDATSDLRVSVAAPPTDGTVRGGGDGDLTLRYAPSTNFNGTDAFEYRVEDPAGKAATATVTVTVTGVNDAPVARRDQYTTREGRTLTVATPGVLSNDDDPDEDPLTATKVEDSGPSKGRLVSLGTDGGFVYEPNGDFRGLGDGESEEVTFAYRASDGTATAQATVTITIEGENTAPVATADGPYQAREDQTLRVTDPANGLLANDRDPEQGTLTALGVTTPAQKGTVTTLNDDGTFVYEPDPNANGPDRFRYRIEDAAGQTAEAEVTLEVAPVSDVVLVDGRADGYTPSPLSPGQEGPVGRLKLKTRESTPEGSVPTLQRLTVASGGASPSGIDSLSLWRSGDDLFDATADAEIASVGYGSSATFSDVGASIPSSGTVYLFLVAELSREAEGQYHPLVPDEAAVRLSGGSLSTYNGTRTSTFADAYLAEQPTPLPVELAAFEAARVEAGIALRWTTARETGNAAFEVQRRPAGTERSWQTVGRRAGAGTTTRPQDYRWTDEELPYAADSLAYRLRQVDTDGSVEVSEPITVGRGTVQQLQLRKTYPNPARDHVTVRYAVPPSAGGPARLALYDVLGRRVRTVAAAPGEGRTKRRLDTSGLASGIYVLRLRAGGTAKTRRLTVVR